ncbi:MAG: metal ABC transporter permease [Planctomycetota bacterium]|jgi:zinc transport system permease protein
MDLLLEWIASQFAPYTFLNSPNNIMAGLAIILVSVICGGMGGLVVGNRMAFFSDALAHCAFAGVALGFIFCLLTGIPDEYFREWITIVMVAFGIVIGVLIAWVRGRTGLASDTVIGVFFAFAVGLGAVFSKLIGQHRRLLSIESFIFGDPLGVRQSDLIALLVLLAVTVAFLGRYYNELILTSVHASLAKSRRVPVEFLRYVLIILLGLIVNLCLNIVGVLLINGLLIVPAAAAANVTRNLRQHFWCTLLLTVACGIAGQLVCWEINAHFRTELGIGGVIVVLVSLCFFASMAIAPALRRRSA